ncbi:MAG: helix-turn-helix transcriptional regulator [Lachnospiraceae bacterium]|nr:helix-turn-helix transcriptional regulator [Lachnospiraceae bacterium]
MITYNPFWKTMKEKNISTYKLENTYGMSKSLIHKLRHNESITIHTLNHLCNIFKCNIADIIDYTED